MSDLNSKKATFTRNLIIEAAGSLALQLPLADISYKRVAEEAGISPRTMFRYFPTRDEFLDALTAYLHAQLRIPDVPDEPAELTNYVAQVFNQFALNEQATCLLLDSEMYPRVRQTSAKERLEQLQACLSAAYKGREENLVLLTAANLRYLISAATWRYYREYFGFDQATTITSIQMLVNQSMALLASGKTSD